MRTRSFAAAALAAALVVPAGMTTAKAYAASSPAQYQDRPWDQPPDEYRDVQRQGFHDGIEAARHDWAEHRHKDMDDHEMYKHPPVAHDLRGDYREAFKHGYSEATHHMKYNRDHDDDDRNRY